VNAAHRRQVDDETAVVDRVAGDVVPVALDREEQVLLAREVDGVDDVGRSGALDDQRGPAVDESVPERAGIVVALVPGRRTAPPSTNA
jgi:hypothetical protein